MGSHHSREVDVGHRVYLIVLFTFTFMHLADAFIQSNVQYILARVVTIYRYDGIPRYKHVRLSYSVYLLIYGFWRK